MTRIDLDPDIAIRLVAFEHLRRLVVDHGPVLEWEVIAGGLVHGGQRMLLANRARGIFRPTAMTCGALSIKTTVPREGREARYDDQIASAAGHFVYRFQGDDPSAWDNRLLLDAHRLGAPLIYFYGVAPSLYRPVWPVFVTAWDAANLSCHVAVDDAIAVGVAVADDPEIVLRRRYATVEAKKRLHQDQFRALVLRAYNVRCAVCGLPRDELLDAAHIIPDRDERGRPEVPNGLALCQLHHRAYDRYVIGIRPDHVVEVAPRVMADHDGPVMEHALKGMHGRTILLPARNADQPRPEYLEERFEEFRKFK